MKAASSEMYAVAAREAALAAENVRLRSQLEEAKNLAHLSYDRHSKRIIESAIDYGIIGLDLDGLVTSWNEGARRIMGGSENDLLGKPAGVFFTAADREQGIPQAEMRAAIQEGRGTDERWHLKKDGSCFWANGEMMTLRNEQGMLEGFIKILRDRTEQRNAAEKQRADAEFLRSILAASDDCINVLDLDGSVTFMNEVGQRLMEVSDFNAISGGSWPDFWQDNGHDDALAAVLIARAGGIGEFQGTAKTLAGSLRWWDVRVTPILGADGSPKKLLSVSRDISVAKKADQALRDSEERYRSLYQSIDAGFCIVEIQCDEAQQPHNYRFREANPAFERQTGLKNTTGEWMRGLAPEHEEYWFQVYKKIAESGLPARLEYPVHTLSDRYYDVRAYRVGSPSAHLMAVLFTDISNRMQNEAQLRALNETLEERVQQRTRERDQIWQVSRDMLGVADSHGIWLSINPAWVRILGWNASEVIGKTSEWLEHPEDRGRIRAENARLAAGLTTLDFENRFLTRDGDYRTLFLERCAPRRPALLRHARRH